IALETVSADTWNALLERLGLNGIVYNIASHCELRARQNTHFQFVLDEDNAGLYNPGHAEKLRLALENYFSQPLTVDVEPAQLERESPAQIAARQKLERQHQAVVAIENDPKLQALIARFDGVLDHASIAPTDT
ncbi:MAG: DNA polymerase III subunit gamma/tau C-terminal domain-containing protein, partial [Halioglobus sp.]